MGFVIVFLRDGKWIFLPGGIPKKVYVLVIVLAFFFGVLVEILQRITNLGRTAELMDLAWDLAGILLGIILAGLYAKFRSSRNIKDLF